MRLREKPGATVAPVSAPLGRKPTAIAYKVMGKMFAIIGLSKVEHVILKCDPHLVEYCAVAEVVVEHAARASYWEDLALEVKASTQSSAEVRNEQLAYGDSPLIF